MRTLKVTGGTCSTWSLSQPPGTWAVGHCQVRGPEGSRELYHPGCTQVAWGTPGAFWGCSCSSPGLAQLAGTLSSCENYSPLSLPTWKQPSSSGVPWERALFFTRAKATCPRKSACTFCAPQTLQNLFKHLNCFVM